jgi:hypothetical protein
MSYMQVVTWGQERKYIQSLGANATVSSVLRDLKVVPEIMHNNVRLVPDMGATLGPRDFGDLVSSHTGMNYTVQVKSHKGVWNCTKSVTFH